MGLTTRLLRLPRPKTFLYTMSLSTGASLITLSLLLNKVSALYGLLALLTGFELNTLQLSMYIYSLVALGLTASLAPHIRSQSPLHCLALAWFYTLDSVVNAAYTAAFGVTWFLVLAQHKAGQKAGDKGPGAGTIDETAGFTDPEHNVSHVDIGEEGGVVAAPPASAPAGTDTSASSGGGGSATISNSVLQPESMNSLGVIIALWTIRLYFCVVMLSYARMVLRRHIALSSIKNNSYTAASKDAGMAENPFREAGGWKGRLGRIMVAFPKAYWLGDDGEAGDEEGVLGGGDVRWMEGIGGKFRKTGTAGAAGANAGIGPANGAASAGTEGSSAVESSGPLERERRRRSGTGPPPPSLQLTSPPSAHGQNGLSVPLQDLS